MTIAIEPRERGILFSDRLVRAILEGRKTQTRRIVKSQPAWNGARWVWPLPKRVHHLMGPDTTSVCSGSREWHAYMPPGCCPCGVPGDRLYVREAWATNDWYDETSPSDMNPEDAPLFWRATDEESDYPSRGRWRPSIHMPKWASRIMLEITGVRVERVQEISDADALAEGVQPRGVSDIFAGPRRLFADLWNQTNGHREGCTWADNPWVWVLEFRRVR